MKYYKKNPDVGHNISSVLAIRYGQMTQEIYDCLVQYDSVDLVVQALEYMNRHFVTLSKACEIIYKSEAMRG